MSPIIRLFVLLIVCMAACAAARAQSISSAQVSKVFAVLSKTIDTKTAARGDEVILVTMNDLAVGGKIVIPKGSKLVGHISSIAIKGKDATKSALAIVLDRAVTDQSEIPVRAIVAAIAAPQPAESKQADTRNDNARDQALQLKEDSTGALGYEGVSIAWNLAVPPPSTIFTTTAKYLKLVEGTQVLLRMIPPQASD